MYWGLSEATDLLAVYRRYNKETDVEELNILLYGSGDIRHILQTVAQQRSDRKEFPVMFNFYMVDGCVDVVARNLLLLDVILAEGDDEMSLLGRTHLFMDLYGNSFIRPFSRDYQKKAAAFFTSLVSGDLDAIQGNYSPILDLSGLKYRDRDQLQDVFNFWRSEATVELSTQWDQQMRKYLGQRYDYRRGAFDWDLHMELRYRGGERICNQEYVDFREKGIAFQFPEFEYSFENKSLVVCQKDVNHRKSYHLMTDMHTGPFPSFGLHCDDDEMMKSSHGENSFRSTDITERNILKILHNIRLQENPTNAELRKHKLGSARFTPGVILTADEEEIKSAQQKPRKLLELPEVKLHILSPEMIKRLSHQEKFLNFFDVAFIGAGCFQYLDDRFVKCVTHNGIILFELLELSLLNKEKRAEFIDQVKQFSKSNDLELMTNFNLNKHYTTYDYKRCNRGGYTS